MIQILEEKKKKKIKTFLGGVNIFEFLVVFFKTVIYSEYAMGVKDDI